MDYGSIIDKIMKDVEDGSTEPFIIYRDSGGGWHCSYTQNQYGDEFAWVEDVKEKDLFAVTFTGEYFARGSLPFVYDNVLTARLCAEYNATLCDRPDADHIHTLLNFFEENIGEFGQDVTDYLTELDRPLAMLHRMDLPRLYNGVDDYDTDKTGEAIDAIESRIAELRSRKNEEIRRNMPQKRNIEGYEEITSIQLAGRIVVLAENPDAENQYMVCNIRWDNPLGVEERYDGAVTDNYLEAISEFIDRQTVLLGDLRDERTPGFPFQKITAADCIPGSLDTDLLGKVIIIKPESLAPEYRCAEHQYAVCTGGFGASPDSRGNAVFAKLLFSGKENRYERPNVAGIADPAKMPEWVKTKLAVMEALKEQGVFEYGGYHFKPVRQFRKGEVSKRLAGDSRPWKMDAQYEMRNMRSDRELGLSTYDWKKTEYSHEQFYAASGNSEADIFMCIENGRMYVPYENELYQYNEPPQRAKSAEKKPSLLGKLDDNKQKVDRDKTERKDQPTTTKRHTTEVTD